MTDPSKFDNTTAPFVVKDPGDLSPAQKAVVDAAITKICNAKDLIQPFSTPPLPAGGLYDTPPTFEQRLCAAILKALLARAWANLPEKTKDGEIKEGDLKPGPGKPANAEPPDGYTAPDSRDGNGEKRTAGDHNIVVLPRGKFSAATGSYNGAGAAVSVFSVAQIVFHEYQHCTEVDFGDNCQSLVNHFHIHRMTQKFFIVLAGLCPPPALGHPDFNEWRRIQANGSMLQRHCKMLADELGWTLDS